MQTRQTSGARPASHAAPSRGRVSHSRGAARPARGARPAARSASQSGLHKKAASSRPGSSRPARTPGHTTSFKSKRHFFGRGGSRPAKEKAVSAPRIPRGRMDISFFFLVITLSAIGLIMVFSASYATSLHETSNSLKIIQKQAFFVVGGLVLMFVASYVPYQWYEKLRYFIYGGSALLMVVALFFKNDSGASRWIVIPGLGTFQPSEMMKFGIIIMFAHLISVNYRRMDRIRYGFFVFLAWLAIPLVLIVLQRHLSGMVLFVIIGFGMMFVGGSKIRWFIVPAAGVGVLGALYLSFKGFDYLTVRFQSWLDPFSNIRDGSWQICQSLYAIGSGGLLGVGLGNSTQKFLWVSEPQNDFIFCIVCEELGLLGAVAIILLFVLFVASGISIAMRAPDRFSSMVVTGIVMQFGVQALLNIAVVCNAMPTTGISLPFFSAGGTATLMQLAQVGVVLGISRYCRPSISALPEQGEESPQPEKTPASPQIH